MKRWRLNSNEEKSGAKAEAENNVDIRCYERDYGTMQQADAEDGDDDYHDESEREGMPEGGNDVVMDSQAIPSLLHSLR